MKPNLLLSRKFWLMVLDVTISTITVCVGWWVNPALGEKLLVLIGIWQPVVISLIASITVQNVEAMKADALIAEAEAYKLDKPVN